MLLHFICIPVKPKAPWQLWLPVTGGSGQCPAPFLGSHRNWWRLGCLELQGGGRQSSPSPSLTGHICHSEVTSTRTTLPSPRDSLPVHRQEVGTGHLISASRCASNGGKECHLILVISWVGGNMNPPSCLLGQSEENPVIFEEQEADQYFQHKNSKKAGKSRAFLEFTMKPKHYWHENHNKRKYLPIYRAVLRKVLFSRSKKFCHIVQQPTESSI